MGRPRGLGTKTPSSLGSGVGGVAVGLVGVVSGTGR